MTGIVPSKEFKRSLEEATNQYQVDLIEEPRGLLGQAFLTSRGITQTARDYFRLGYVENNIPEHRDYKGMVCIPYITRGGIVTIRFRNLPDETGTLHGGKYQSLHGVAGMVRLYNPRALDRTEQFICICEGEFDTIIASQCGLPAVGLPGAKAWKKEYASIFRYRTVYVLADNDDKGDGRNFAERIAEHVPGTRIIMMPDGHDVNSFYLTEGRDALRGVIGI